MFVSSYNTYITHKPSPKVDESTQKEYQKSSLYENRSFATELDKIVSSSTKIPLNYISNYKALNNQQLLQQQGELNKDYVKAKFSKINKINNAQTAYSENAKLFTFSQKPKVALLQEPKIPQKLEQNALIKQNFINTYIANDNYYKVTAA